MSVPNTSVFAPGSMLPPEIDQRRVREQRDNLDLYRGEYNSLWPELRYERQRGSAGTEDEPRLRPNLLRLATDFLSEAVVGELPVASYDAGNAREEQFLEAVSKATLRAAPLVVLDLVRCGTGAFINKLPLQPQHLSPVTFFPVRDQWAPDEPTGTDVVAFSFREGTRLGADNRVYVAVYEPGIVTERIHQYDGTTIGEVRQTLGGETGQAAHAGQAVVPVTLGGETWGRSPYEDAKLALADLWRRESLLSVALDRHANPHLALPWALVGQGLPGTSLSGQWERQEAETMGTGGRIIPVQSEDVVPTFVEWNPRFDAHHEAIQRAYETVLRALGVSPLLLSLRLQGQLNVPSGSALRRLAVSTVQRISQYRAVLGQAMSLVIEASTRLNAARGGESVVLDHRRISWTWPPALSSIMDESEAVRVLVDSGALGAATARQLVEGLTRSEADEAVGEAEPTDEG